MTQEHFWYPIIWFLHNKILIPVLFFHTTEATVTLICTCLFPQTGLKTGNLLTRLIKLLLHSIMVLLLTFTINYLTKVKPQFFFSPSLVLLLFSPPWFSFSHLQYPLRLGISRFDHGYKNYNYEIIIKKYHERIMQCINPYQSSFYRRWNVL